MALLAQFNVLCLYLETSKVSKMNPALHVKLRKVATDFR